MNILQFNTQSLRTSKRYLEGYVDKNQIDILARSETWNKDKDIHFKNWNCKDLHKDRTQNTYGGVAALARNNMKIVR